MLKKILKTTAVHLMVEEAKPPILSITARGEVTTGGWSDGQLSAYIYIKAPLDGIYEFDFISEAPVDITTDVITPIEAKIQWTEFPSDLKGIKVYSSSNGITTFLLVASPKNSSKAKFIENVYDLKQVSAGKLKKVVEKNDVVFITNVYVWEDVLHVGVRYAGGCAKHNFQLVWDGKTMESNPPKVRLFLIHDNAGDICRAIVQEDLQFVINSLDHGTTIVLEGWENEIHF